MKKTIYLIAVLSLTFSNGACQNNIEMEKIIDKFVLNSQNNISFQNGLHALIDKPENDTDALEKGFVFFLHPEQWSILLAKDVLIDNKDYRAVLFSYDANEYIALYCIDSLRFNTEKDGKYFFRTFDPIYMDAKILAVSSQFKTNKVDRVELAKKLMPLLKNGSSIQKVETILGTPTTIVLSYTLFYSSALILFFDNEGKLKEVSSDLLEELNSSETPAKDFDSPKIKEAISSFKKNPFNRQNPAKTLIPLIKIGMPISEVTAIFGSADGKSWEYNLKLSSSLNIQFSKEDKIEDVSLFGL
ncbi:MAG: hypothetical protein L3J20_06225 [Flavobacteriaceae bacterium]|nr:hypothetical protein [Flavobacteriaceae bacterium]